MMGGREAGPEVRISSQDMSVADFVRRYYKPNRLSAMPGRFERIVADRENDVRLRGEAIISHHDCVTGGVARYLQEAEAASVEGGRS